MRVRPGREFKSLSHFDYIHKPCSIFLESSTPSYVKVSHDKDRLNYRPIDDLISTKKYVLARLYLSAIICGENLRHLREICENLRRE